MTEAELAEGSESDTSGMQQSTEDDTGSSSDDDSDNGSESLDEDAADLRVALAAAGEELARHIDGRGGSGGDVISGRCSRGAAVWAVFAGSGKFDKARVANDAGASVVQVRWCDGEQRWRNVDKSKVRHRDAQQDPDEEFKVGDRVQARYGIRGALFYEATIKEVHKSWYRVKWADGDQRNERVERNRGNFRLFTPSSEAEVEAEKERLRAILNAVGVDDEEDWPVERLRAEVEEQGVNADVYEEKIRDVLMQAAEDDEQNRLRKLSLLQVLNELEKRNVVVLESDSSDSSDGSEDELVRVDGPEAAELKEGVKIEFEAGYFPDWEGTCRATLSRRGTAHTRKHGLQPTWAMECEEDGAVITQPTIALVRELRLGRVRVV